MSIPVAQHRYVIVGGGVTADSAISGIRKSDASASIAVISAEKHPPYNRPPLSKTLWKGKPLDSIWRNTAAGPGISLHLGRKAVAINRARKTVTDDQGEVYAYDKLLLATGGSPRRLPLDDRGVMYYRTLDDYHRLRKLAGLHSKFVVIGGGFIGSEIAAALAMNQKKVTMIFPGKSIGARAYPSSLGVFLNAYYRDRGVNLLCGDTVSLITELGDKTCVQTSGGNTIATDAVIAGIGIQPEVELARSIKLPITDGIVVDECLRTADPDIYAAGNVANFFCPALETRVRIEHEDNAISMGETAGRNMAGQVEPYLHLPFFYSDLFDLGYEAVGVLDADLDIVEDWQQQFRKGVVYYLKDGRVRGVLLWNTWGQIDAARDLIASKTKFGSASLIGRIAD